MRLAILASHPIQYQAPLFRALAERSDIHVFFAHRATPREQAEAGFGTEFEWDLDLTEGYGHSFLSNRATTPGTDRFSGCDTPDIGHRLAAGRFDALLMTGWRLKADIQGVIAARRLRIPVIVRGDSHLDTPRNRIKRAVKRIAYPGLLRAFGAALYVGRRNRAYYEHYRYPEDRLFFSPHCVDAARFAAGATERARVELRARLGVGAEEKIALFAGKLVDFKRPLDLVDAAAIARAQGLSVRVAVAGAGPLEDELRARADAARVPLHILGFRNQTEMPAAYAASDVLALPSTGRETWGLVCNEALACGRPIVVSDAVGCAPDLAADGDVGRIFPLGDAHAFAAALSGVLRAPPTAQAIRELSDRYSLSAACDGILRAVEHVTRGRA